MSAPLAASGCVRYRHTLRSNSRAARDAAAGGAACALFSREAHLPR
jgi:hypothetical protein